MTCPLPEQLGLFSTEWPRASIAAPGEVSQVGGRQIRPVLCKCGARLYSEGVCEVTLPDGRTERRLYLRCSGGAFSVGRRNGRCPSLWVREDEFSAP